MFAGIWDLCENAQITAMLLMYPDIGETQVAWASFFTHVKTAWIGPAYQWPAIAFVLVALLRAVMRRWSAVVVIVAPGDLGKAGNAILDRGSMHVPAGTAVTAPCAGQVPWHEACL